MLVITIQGEEFFDEKTNEFSTVGDFQLELEHSLLSLSKWESKFQKPFLKKEDKKTHEEVLAYIEAMILSPVYPVNIWEKMTPDNVDAIQKYIDSSQTATTFRDLPGQKGRAKPEIVTSELIYYWMVAFNIPFQCERWHLNRLFALIRICNIKNGKQPKMSKRDIAANNRALNEQRRQSLGTSG